MHSKQNNIKTSNTINLLKGFSVISFSCIQYFSDLLQFSQKPVISKMNSPTEHFATYFARNQYFLTSRWFPLIAQQIKVQEILTGIKYFRTKRKVLTKTTQCIRKRPIR